MACNSCSNNDCSASLYLKEGSFYILGHYGSRYDMELYALKRATYSVGEICDDCVRQLINEGLAQKIEDGVW
jgi:hypothetical protein